MQAPSSVRTGQAVTVTVERDGVQRGASIQAQSKAIHPALFAYAAAGSLYAAAVFPDGAIAGDPVKTPGTRATKPKDVVSLFGTGFGVSPSGVLIGAATALPNPVEVTVGGKPATVTYAGLVGVGLFQINIVIPELASGDHPIVVRYQACKPQPLPALQCADRAKSPQSEARRA